MWPHTSRLDTTLAAGGTVVTRLDILADGELALSLDSTDPLFTDLGGILDGRVDVQPATVRRTADLTLLDVDRALTQGQAMDLLVPLAAEVRLWRGAIYSDTTSAELPPDDRELVPLGTLVVVDADFTRWPTIGLVCRDRAWLLSQYRNVTAFSTASGTASMTALTDLIQFTRFPASRVSLNFPATAFTTGAQVWDKQADPAEAAQQIAAAAGLVFYADPMGVFTCAPQPDVDNDPVVATYTEGAGQMLLMPTRRLSGDGARNAVVAESSAPDLAAPVSGYAEDDDPNSLTYVGRIGPIPDFYDSPLLRTSAQCDLAARTRLRNIAGLLDTTAVAAMVNPALETGDVIYVKSATRGIDTKLIADSFSVPLRAAESQSITCRARTVTS
jgi:hypothetical protein